MIGLVGGVVAETQPEHAAGAVERQPVAADQARVLEYLGRQEMAVEAWHRCIQAEPEPGLLRAATAALKMLEFGKVGLRERQLFEHNSLLLGTACDDGVEIPAYWFYNAGYFDVACTLSRFLSIWRVFGWPLTAICALESEALPVAHTLARAMALPVLPQEDRSGLDFALLVAIRARPRITGRDDIPGPPCRCMQFALCAKAESGWADICGGPVTP